MIIKCILQQKFKKYSYAYSPFHLISLDGIMLEKCRGLNRQRHPTKWTTNTSTTTALKRSGLEGEEA